MNINWSQLMPFSCFRIKMPFFEQKFISHTHSYDWGMHLIISLLLRFDIYQDWNQQNTWDPIVSEKLWNATSWKSHQVQVWTDKQTSWFMKLKRYGLRTELKKSVLSANIEQNFNLFEKFSKLTNIILNFSRVIAWGRIRLFFFFEWFVSQ